VSATPRMVSHRGIKAFEAKYSSRCGNCGEDINPKDKVFYDGKRVLGVECCTSEFTPENREREPDIPVMPRGKTAADRCDSCFIIHASGQVECQ
jgi:hypothetical protein